MGNIFKIEVDWNIMQKYHNDLKTEIMHYGVCTLLYYVKIFWFRLIEGVFGTCYTVYFHWLFFIFQSEIFKDYSKVHFHLSDACMPASNKCSCLLHLHLCIKLLITVTWSWDLCPCCTLQQNSRVCNVDRKIEGEHVCVCLSMNIMFVGQWLIHHTSLTLSAEVNNLCYCVR